MIEFTEFIISNFEKKIQPFTIPEIIAESFKKDLLKKIYYISEDIIKVEKKLINNSFLNRLDIKNSDSLLLDDYLAFETISKKIIDNYVDFCLFFYEDLLELKHRQNDIEEIVFLGSDSHSNSRSVIKVIFKNRLNLIYKPRQSKPELLLYKTFKLLNEGTNILKFKYPDIYICSNGHFMDYIPSIESKTKKEKENFFERIGYLFVVSYLFDLTDLHFENIIVCGENPIIIDCETIFNNYKFREFIITEEKNKDHEIDYFLDKCGLFDFPKIKTEIIKNISGSRLFLIDYDLDYNKKIELIKKGIFKIIAAIKLIQDEILCLINNNTENLKSRFLLRSTYKYYEIITEINKAKNLFTDSKQNHILDIFFIKNNILIPSIIKTEKQALLNRDIPLFYIDINTGNIYDDNKLILTIELNETPKQIVNNKIRCLSDLTFQEEINYLENKLTIIDKIKLKNLYTNNYLNKLYFYFDNLFLKQKNKKNYFPSVKINESGSIIVDYLNYSLYDGVIGNFMLFNYILSVDNFLYEFNKDTIYYFKNIVNYDILNMEINKVNLGVYEGISGLLYFIKNCQNKELKKFEDFIINNLYFEIENKDINPNFFEGLGGIIIVLSKFQKSDDDKIRFKKIVCKYLIYLENNFNLINNCGLAHGISGIILSLLNIIDYGDEVTTLIKLFLEKEDSLFNFENSNWPDSRYKSVDSKYLSNYWCNGKHGILLVRSLLHKNGIINIYEQEYFSIIEKDTLIDSGCNHLCCGTAGQMACLYEIGININEEKLTAKARNYYSNLMEISQMNFPFPQNNLSNNFSLMTGFTGVLYYYHKINHDSLMPNILILE